MKCNLMCMAALAALSLAACGGGGGRDEAAELTTVPDEAVASARAFTQWVGAHRPSDAGHTLAMNAATPPPSETAEPVDVD